MNILITGSSGFLGAYITAKLIAAHHLVTCAGRDVNRLQYKFPSCNVIQCNFATDSIANWEPRLKNIEIVINVVGLLKTQGANDIYAVQDKGTIALFDACQKMGVRKIIHISALGIDDENTTDYSLSKKKADQHLQSMHNTDWVILKPSLVYAPGCFGGTSLLRALAVFPFIIPVVGKGKELYQPVSIDDLTDVILKCVEQKSLLKKTICVVGAEQLNIGEILSFFRTWLGLAPGKMIHVPQFFANIGCKIGDLINHPTLSSTAFKMMQRNNIASESEFNDFAKLLGRPPQKMSDAIQTMPLTVQSLWYARLYLLKMLLKLTLGVYWITLGLITLFVSKTSALWLLHTMGFPAMLAGISFYISAAIAIFLGVLLCLNRNVKNVLLIQMLVILSYTIGATYFEPSLWLDPMGSLTKNIPLFLLTLIMLIIEDEK